MHTFLSFCRFVSLTLVSDIPVALNLTNELRRGSIADKVQILLMQIPYPCLLYLCLNIDSTLAAAIMSIPAENWLRL